MEKMKKAIVLLVFAIAMIFCTLPVSHIAKASVSPATLDITLSPGQSHSETKEVTVDDFIWDGLSYPNGYYPYDNVTVYLLTTTFPPGNWMSISPGAGHIVPFWSSLSYTFNVLITVPAGTLPGVYNFKAKASVYGFDDVFIDYTGEQDVTVRVPGGPENVVPEAPIGTIGASAAMIIALAVYFAMPKLKRNRRLI
jgi:hypothetical protein